MNPIIIKVIIVSFIVLGGAASGYEAYTNYAGASGPSMTQFVPANSTFVVQIHNSSANYIAFGANNSIGILASISETQFFQSLNSTNNYTKTNNSHEYQIQSVGSYYGFEIFAIELNQSFLLSKISSLYAFNQSYNFTNYSIMNNLSNMNSSGNLEIYLSSVGTSFILLGGLGGVHAGILAEHAKSGINYNRFMDPSANISIYYHQTNKIFNLLTANVTVAGGNLTINSHVNFTSVTYETFFLQVVVSAMKNISTSLNYSIDNSMVTFNAVIPLSSMNNISQMMKSEVG